MLLAAIKSMQEQAIYLPGPLKLIIQLKGEPLTKLANQIEEYEGTYKNWYWWQRWWNARKTKEIERKRQMLCLAWLWNEAELRDSGAGLSEERCLIGEKLKHHLPKLGKKYWIDGKEWRGYWQDEWMKRNTRGYTKASVVLSQEKGWFNWMMSFFKREEVRKVISREEMQIQSQLDDLTMLIKVACNALKQAQEKLKEGAFSKEDMQKLIEHRNERIVDLYEKIKEPLFKQPNGKIWDKYKEKLIQAMEIWLNAHSDADLFLIKTTLWEKKKVIIDAWEKDKVKIKMFLEEAINRIVELKVEKKEERFPEVEKKIKKKLASLRRQLSYKYHPDRHRENPQKKTAERIFTDEQGPLFDLFFTILEKPRVAAGIQLVIMIINEFDASKLLTQVKYLQKCFDAGSSKELDGFLDYGESVVNNKVTSKEIEKMQKEIEESDQRIAKMQAKINENDEKIKEQDEKMNVLFALLNERKIKENPSEKSKEKLDPIIPEPTTNHQKEAKSDSNIMFTFFGQKKEENHLEEPSKELANKIELK